MFDEGLLRDLDEAIGRLGEVDLGLAGDVELGELIVALRARVDRLDAQWQGWFAFFDRRVGWQRGARTAAAWLRRFCRMASGTARMRVLAVRRLPRLDATRAAYEAGDISFAHVATITRSVTELREEHVEAADRVFADAARDLCPKDLGKVVALWRETVDPQAPIKDLESAHARRKLWAAKVGDMVQGEFQLDVVDGEKVLAGLSAFFEAGRAKNDPRSREQRHADALVDLVEAALRAGTTPLAGGERPHITVTASIDTLEARAGAPPAELEWGGPIPGEVARMLACDARVCRVITGINGIPVEASAPTRSVPRWLRRLLIVRDKRCRMPGCDRPPGWCIAHHIVFWGDGGPTQLDNLVLLCREHHNDVHLRGWLLRLEPDGTVITTSPVGIDYEDPPPGRAELALLAGEQRARYRPHSPRPGRPEHRTGHPARAP